MANHTPWPLGRGVCACQGERAVRYLRENGYDAGYFSGPSLDRYYAEMERFYDRPDADMWSQYAFQDSLFATGEYFPDLKRRYDRDNLPEGYLEHRVVDALNQWHTSPFARELDFAGFCEYLLPCRKDRNTAMCAISLLPGRRGISLRSNYTPGTDSH